MPAWGQWVHLLAPSRCGHNFISAFFHAFFQTLYNLVSWALPVKLILRGMPEKPIDEKSTLVQVMAWCRQATSHYLNHCWPRSAEPYDVTMNHVISTRNVPITWSTMATEKVLPFWAWSHQLLNKYSCHSNITFVNIQGRFSCDFYFTVVCFLHYAKLPWAMQAPLMDCHWHL